jgi:hypothetical protein
MLFSQGECEYGERLDVQPLHTHPGFYLISRFYKQAKEESRIEIPQILRST